MSDDRAGGLTRRRFLELVPASAGALLCTPLAACLNGGHIDGSVENVSGQATVSFAQFPRLMTVGGGVVVAASSGQTVLVVRTSQTTATALDAICTHQGCVIDYSAASPPITCGCHGSAFALDGAVVNGPANRPLSVYAAVVGAGGIVVTLA